MSLFELTPAIPEGVNWDKVLELAKTQCIVPLVVACVPDEQKSKWHVIDCQCKAHFMQILYEQNSLFSLLKNNNIPFVILKGTAASVYYPSPSLRTFGDIDFYISDYQADITKDLLEKNGYTYLSSNIRHIEFKKNGIDFELHYKFSCDAYKNIDSIVINGMNNAVEYKICNTFFPALPTYENGLVLLGHIMQHIKGSGIGLRQIIDWMMFVHKELDDVAWKNKFRSLAVEAGLEKLAVTITLICKKWLGLPNNISWCNDADDEVAEQLLLRIFDDGNLGHDRTSSESVRVSMKKEGTLKYLQKSGMVHWSLAQKYSVFRPFAWLYQLCRYLGKGIVGLFTGKKVFIKNKNIISIEELWEKLE